MMSETVGIDIHEIESTLGHTTMYMSDMPGRDDTKVTKPWLFL